LFRAHFVDRIRCFYKGVIMKQEDQELL